MSVKGNEQVIGLGIEILKAALGQTMGFHLHQLVELLLGNHFFGKGAPGIVGLIKLAFLLRQQFVRARSRNPRW